MPSKVKLGMLLRHTIHICKCGCGLECDARYVQGHWAKHHPVAAAKLIKRNKSKKMRKGGDGRGFNPTAMSAEALEQRKRNISKGMQKRLDSDPELKKRRGKSLHKYLKQNPSVLVERSKNLSKLMTKLWSDENFSKERLSTITNQYECGWIKTKKAGDIYYHSSWEKIFIELLDSSKRVVRFVAEPFTIPYTYKGKDHSYYPDFLLILKDGRTCVVELKGRIGKKEKYKFREAIKFCKANGYIWAPIFECPKGVTRYIQ